MPESSDGTSVFHRLDSWIVHGDMDMLYAFIEQRDDPTDVQKEVLRMKCEIKLGPRSTELWTRTPFYCPHCAETTVWEAAGGVYPVGPELFCATCGGSFYSPQARSLEEMEGKERMERARAIREADHILQPSDAISPPASS
jgi:hypothetical protein